MQEQESTFPRCSAPSCDDHGTYELVGKKWCKQHAPWDVTSDDLPVVEPPAMFPKQCALSQCARVACYSTSEGYRCADHRYLKADEDPRNVEGYGETDDPVVHPTHYNVGNIEVIDAITDWGLGFQAGNVVKYVARYRHKHETKAKQVEDLKKARFYLDHLIAQLEAE